MKEGGCNKLACSCGAYICDYCGKDITTQLYGHFSDSPNSLRIPGLKKCPTYDDDYTRNKRNMDQAEKEAQDRVRRENPDISEEDLKIKMKESVRSPVTRPRQLGFAGVHPPAAAGMMAARQHVYMPPMQAAGVLAMPADAFVPGYGPPTLVASMEVHLWATSRHPCRHGRQRPREAADVRYRQGHHDPVNGHVPAPRRHRGGDAVADRADRIQPGARDSGYAFHGDGMDEYDLTSMTKRLMI